MCGGREKRKKRGKRKREKEVKFHEWWFELIRNRLLMVIVDKSQKGYISYYTIFIIFNMK